MPDASVNVIVSANAMHYFSTPEAIAEICRVLVPGGVLGVFYKEPNMDIEPWTLEVLKENAKWYQQAGVNYDIDDTGHASVGWGLALKASGLFHEIQSATVAEYDPMNEEMALEYLMSFGAFNVCSKDQKSKLRERCKKLLHDSYSGAGRKMTEFPMKSFMYWAKKK